jgi:hypothetical protein
MKLIFLNRRCLKNISISIRDVPDVYYFQIYQFLFKLFHPQRRHQIIERPPSEFARALQFKLKPSNMAQQPQAIMGSEQILDSTMHFSLRISLNA